MPNVIRLYVENPDEIRNAGAYDTGALMRVQSASTEAGTYADLTGTGSTPTIAIVAGTRAYTAYDPSGSSSTWYRTRYENSGGTRVSDWSTPFQAGDEQAGRLCSLYDAKQRLGITDSTDDELLAEIIDQVTDEIIAYTGRQLVPDPLSGTKTVYLDYPDHGDGVTLWLPRGVRSVTYLGVASSDQPADGSGMYTEITGGIYLDPPEHERSRGWPGTRVTLGSSANATFTAGKRTVKATGAFGWAAVPPTIERIAIAAVVSRYMSKGAEGPRAAIGPDGRMIILRDISPADMAVLDQYRDIPVGYSLGIGR